MNNAIKNYLNTPTPVTERATATQVENSTGGFVFASDAVQRLTRFLVLGTDGGTYYAKEHDITKENVDFIIDMIKRDELTVLETVCDVSFHARAPKNSTALFVLALVFVYGQDKQGAGSALLTVARTGTHLFEFVSYLKALGGLGRAKRRAIANWYLSKDNLALQVIKYRSRHGYTHRDLLRLSHVVGLDPAIGDFILNGTVTAESPEVIRSFAEAQKVTSAAEAVKVVKMNRSLPWEAFPTEVHKAPEFWEALFYNGMGATALLRNVTRFDKLGLFGDLKFAGDVAKALSDPEAIRKGRLHPVQYLNALGMYRQNYTANAKILEALENGFYASFGNVTPANKRTMVSLDVSGSMTWSAPGGLVGTNCMEAAAAMAMVTVRTEPYVEVNAFASSLQAVNISGSDSLDNVVNRLSRLNFGYTNVAAPIEKALRAGQVIDTFVIYTDNEVNYGQHPYKALNEYRRKVNPEARLIVVGMATNGFTVADPDDDKALDVVGFDAAAPKVMADFSAGRL